MIFLHGTVQPAGHWLKLRYVTIESGFLEVAKYPANQTQTFFDAVKKVFFEKKNFFLGFFTIFTL